MFGIGAHQGVLVLGMFPGQAIFAAANAPDEPEVAVALVGCSAEHARFEIHPFTQAVVDAFEGVVGVEGVVKQATDPHILSAGCWKWDDVVVSGAVEFYLLEV